MGRYDFNSITAKLNYIIDNNSNCYFDLTGGKEIVLTAMGVVAAKRNVPLFQFDVRYDRFISILNCDDLLECEKSYMTISEAVGLNGCSVIKGENGDYCWSFTDDFKEDIEKMWEIARIDCVAWNRQSNVFDNLETIGRVDSELTLKASLKSFTNKTNNLIINKRIIDSLTAAGLIYDYSIKGDTVVFKYKNAQIRECLKKAGNILELYAYTVLREIQEENPQLYDDIDLSVYIDWDKVYHSEYDKVKDTKNEIDIMAMRDLIPIFISCKNGEVHKEALYELNTVSQRFGGKYAKKILFATYVNHDKESCSYLKQRAMDMNIRLIDNIDKMSKEKIKEQFLKIVK